MRRVIAAVDDSLATSPVLAAAQAIAELLGARVQAVHIGSGGRVAASEAAAAGLELETFPGPTVARLAHLASAEDVAMLVMGARGTPGGARPVGSTAFEVMAGLGTPLLIVPPDCTARDKFRRVLVPLEGTISTSLAPRGLIQLAAATELEVIVLHVHDEASIPSFTDQPQHEAEAWAEEFVARYVPDEVGDVRLEIRVGRRQDEIVRAAEELGVDLIALGWSQDLAPGRAPVVRAVLERCLVPIMLVPVFFAARTEAEAGERSEAWTS
jgi:nucleotide-binding universal stress UspA family protein